MANVTTTTGQLRLRVRRLIEVKPAPNSRLYSNHRALSVPHVGEVLRLYTAGVQHDGPAYPMPRVIHRHEIDLLGLDPTPSRQCTLECLYCDTVPVEQSYNATTEVTVS